LTSGSGLLWFGTFEELEEASRKDAVTGYGNQKNHLWKVHREHFVGHHGTEDKKGDAEVQEQHPSKRHHLGRSSRPPLV
jgi:hypothetical protein